MRKTLTIGGEKVDFEYNALTPQIYKSQFGKDFLNETLLMAGMQKENIDFVELAKQDFDFELFTRLAWAFAKTADYDNTPDLIEWLREHKEFDRLTDGPKLFDLVFKGTETKKN